ncbi:hypothetical protein [Thermococcus sp. 21S7]|uniref:hypothetical protein n=1 Tax=Thermococcus sp. 21S7 TaxID=1638221 RepID=UPI00143C1265|nr:hypothetical protein [Thermococcus sp. 21S7]NJE61992.1 hypothetical protein [Thermococcus sp. 21S7]
MAGKKGEKKLYYHGLTEQKKLDVSRLKYLSLILSVIGVAVLLVAAQTAQAPLINVGDVYGSYMMNYAVVRINGTVVTVPYVSETGGRIGITFTVDDGTGQIDVRVYSPLAEEMLRQGLVPFPGDNVTAEVQLRVRETYTYAILQYLDGLEFRSKLYSEKPEIVKSLTKEMAGTYVAAEGIVTEFSNVSSGILMGLDTGEGEVTVLVPRVLLVGENVSVKIGDTVYAPGVVYLYKGTSPEIVVRNLSALQVTPIEEAPEVPLGEAQRYPGMTMNVRGELVGVSYEAGRYVLTLVEGGNYLNVLVSRDVLAALDPFEVGTGSVLKVAGRMGDDGRLVGAYAEAVSAKKPEELPIGFLTGDMRGRIVAVRGNIDEIARAGSNLKLVIGDGTGKVAVFIPSAALAELSNGTLHNLSISLGVRVAGYLDEYRGELEIVVYSGNGLRALGRPVEESEIRLPEVGAGELGDYVGRLVDLRGSLGGILYENHTYYLNVDGVLASVPRDVLLNLNPLEAGTGSEVVIRGMVLSRNSIGGENLTVVRAVEPVPVSPDEVTLEMKNRIVAVIGKVTDVANLSGNLKITVGSLPVFVPRSVAGELTRVPVKGDIVKVAGYVEEYRDEPEIVLFNPMAIVAVEESGPAPGTLAELGSSEVPLELTVTWEAMGYEKPNYVLRVRDSTGSASLYVNGSLLPNPFKAGTGSGLRIVADPLSGSITSLEVVKPVPAKLLATGDVGPSLRGTTIAVNGTVLDVASVGSSLKLTVDDGSGGIAVFIPGGAGKVELKNGDRVYLAGYVEEYRDEPEVVVYNLDAVAVAGKPSGGTAGIGEVKVSELPSAAGTVNLTVTWDGLDYSDGVYMMDVHDDTGSTTLKVARSLLPNPFNVGTGSVIRITYDAEGKAVVSIEVVEAVPSPKVATGDVSTDMMGKTVIVEGTIVDLYEGRTFYKLTIDDGSGGLVVFIPKSVAQLTFSEGQTVRVCGYVTEYKGTVEVIPYTGDAIEVR